MSDFKHRFINREDISFTGMRDTAMSFLPNDRNVLDKLYNDLKRGTGILDDEAHLNMYLRSFGKMHKAKLDEAFAKIPDTARFFSDDVEIYDWGCGQGTATICLLDYLASKNIHHNITEVNLIEPSVAATRRAKEIVSCFDNNITINVINKVFDDLTENDFCRSNKKKLHLFSNILDVDSFDCARFTLLFQKVFNGSNFFICVGPYYSNNKRVDEFIAATNPDVMYAIFDKGHGAWINEWTISLRVFSKEFDKVENIHDIRKRIEEAHMHDQFFAGYILDPVAEEYTASDLKDEAESFESLFKSLSVFDVKSDRQLDCHDDCKPKIAVLSNIVSRGLPTKAPVAVEEIFADMLDVSSKPDLDETIIYKSKHKVSKEDIYEVLHIIEQQKDVESNSLKPISGTTENSLQIVLSPLAIARVEKMLLQALLSDVLDFNANEWNILVVERDVPCAAIAVDLLKESFEKISVLDGTNARLPHINLSIFSTEQFANSPLHLGQPVVTSAPATYFDLCMDVSMLLHNNTDTLPLHVNAKAVYIIRSAKSQKRERIVCSARNIAYSPLVTKDTTGTYTPIKEKEEALAYFLRNMFRKPSFRQGQLPILSHSLSDKTTIGLLPTGGGKSLTYQLASMLQPGVTIVVDPLVSLMVDQIRGLHEMRIDTSDYVNSGMDANEKARKLGALQNGSLQFMFLSPERFMMENFRDSLIEMAEKNHIYFAYGVIDEVHCVSEWGHDFHTSYLHLGRNMNNYMHTKSGRTLPIIGLTATASFDVLADVERELTLGGNLTIDSETIVRSEDDTRPELTYRIVDVASNFEPLRDANNSYVLKAVDDWEVKDVVAKGKKRKMYELLKDIPTDVATLNQAEASSTCHISNFSASSFYDADAKRKYHNAGIIFCPHAHGTFGVKDNVWGTHMGISTDLLAKFNGALKIGTFVGGDKPSGDMQLFNDNDLNIMVATKAFGMGIDKPNVRFTINFNHPSSIESFVQEAGRAGRDKKTAISYILYDPTEYVHLTVDKINDMRLSTIKTLNVDPSWLEGFANKFVLSSDFVSFCLSNNCSDKAAQFLLAECKRKGYFENVDKNIDLWFHNNSFRGMYKEKTILVEMTDRILNVKPTYLQEVQGKLIEATGNTDLMLKPDLKRNAVKILSRDNAPNQYGYIQLDQLSPRYNYSNFDYETCRFVSEALIAVLCHYKDHSARALLRPLDGVDNSSEGIYSAMAKADADGYVFVTVSWENQIQQDTEQFERSIKDEITQIAKKQGWQDINEDRYGKLRLTVDSFGELISQISKCSCDEKWLRHHAFNDIYERLRRLFCQKRDKNDTDKAIYRMCCIGLVEDVTIDYLSQSYELKIRKRTDKEFRQSMLDFFRKYYSLEQARRKVQEIDSQKGRNYLDKCLGYLTEFVYSNLEKKRFRAIEDMRNACEDSITQRMATHNDKWIKEFVHLYFNSKYARRDYEVNGKQYSLARDIDEGQIEYFSVVLKYIDIISKDNSGSELDNVKHLYGATLLCLRAHTDNAALLLLLTFCIALLGAGKNETLKKDAVNGYFEGFMTIHEEEGNKVWGCIDRFNGILDFKSREKFIKEELVKNGKETIMLFVHEKEFNKIANKYTKQ